MMAGAFVLPLRAPPQATANRTQPPLSPCLPPRRPRCSDAPDDGRHDGGVGDAQPRHALDPAPRVDHRRRIVHAAHLARAHRVVDRDRVLVHVLAAAATAHGRHGARCAQPPCPPVAFPSRAAAYRRYSSDSCGNGMVVSRTSSPLSRRLRSAGALANRRAARMPSISTATSYCVTRTPRGAAVHSVQRRPPRSVPPLARPGPYAFLVAQVVGLDDRVHERVGRPDAHVAARLGQQQRRRHRDGRARHMRVDRGPELARRLRRRRSARGLAAATRSDAAVCRAARAVRARTERPLASMTKLLTAAGARWICKSGPSLRGRRPV